MRNLEEFKIPYRKGALWGFSDIWGNLIIEPFYDEVEDFEIVNDLETDFQVAIVEKDRLYFLLNLKGDKLINEGLDYIRITWDLIYTYHKLELNNKEGLFYKDEIVIPIVYDKIIEINYGFVTIKDNNKYGVLDLNNQIIIPCIYDEIEIDEDFEHQLLIRFNLKQSGEIITEDILKIHEFSVKEMKDAEDQGFEEAIQEVSISLIGFKKHLERITENNKHGFRILGNNKTIEPIYDEINPIYYYQGQFDECFSPILNQNKFLFTIKIGNKMGLIDEDGLVIFDLEYDKIIAENNYFISLIKDDYYGFYDYRNKLCLEPNKYEYVYPAYYKAKLNSTDIFYTYEVTLEGKKGYLGENEFEYFE